MQQWEAPARPAELAETRLISAILDGTFPINSNLPAERELATKLGVTRPTLREALQRPATFVPNLLQVRVLLAPAYTRLAFERSLTKVVELLETFADIPDTPEAF